MKKTLYQKLITIYIFVGIIAFLFATAGGSHFVESYLEDELGDRFYQCAAQLVSDESFLDLMAAKDVSHLKKLTDILSSAEEADILLLDSEKNILVHSTCQRADTDQDSFSGQTSLPKFQRQIGKRLPTRPEPFTDIIPSPISVLCILL
ncbi:MAG: hypothetical protein V8Q57_06690 [Blautia sp.]